MSDEEEYDQDDYNNEDEDEDEDEDDEDNEEESENDEEDEEDEEEDEDDDKNKKSGGDTPKPRVAFAQYPGDIILSMNKFCKVSIAQKEEKQGKNENIEHIITISTSQPGEISQQLQLVIKDGMCLINQQVGEYVPSQWGGSNQSISGNNNNFNNNNNYNNMDNNMNMSTSRMNIGQPVFDDLSNIRNNPMYSNNNVNQGQYYRANGPSQNGPNLQSPGFSATLNNNALNPSMQFDLTPARPAAASQFPENTPIGYQRANGGGGGGDWSSGSGFNPTTIGTRFNNGVSMGAFGANQRDPRDFYKNTHAINSVLNK